MHDQETETRSYEKIKLKNNFNKKKNHENWCKYENQRNYCVNLLRNSKIDINQITSVFKNHLSIRQIQECFRNIETNDRYL